MKTFSGLFILSLLLLSNCKPDPAREVYHPFPNQSWQRFNILRFEIPVEKSETPRNIVFYARYNQTFPYQALNFNMIMRLPSGEERVREYQLAMKNKSDQVLGTYIGEECETSLFLKKELFITKEGMLEITLENLTPRVETPGLLGVGIRIQDF
ncbi:MAG: hypothetical protein V1733_08695 [bacterium]